MAKATARKASISNTEANKSAKPAVKSYRTTPVDKSDCEPLIAVIQEATGCGAKAAKEAFDGLVGTITASLKKNKKVQLTGFASFTVAKRPARKGRNPRTGETIRVKAFKAIRFEAGQTLKRAL